MDNLHFPITMNKGLKTDLSDVPSPCFVLDEKRLISNLEVLNGIQQKADIKILCAFKGFAMWSSFTLLRKYLAGATASSLHEAKLCFEKFGQKAHVCAPVYPPDEIDEIIDISSHITFNSIEQFNRFGQKAVDRGLSIGLRINPEYSEIDTNIYNPCIPGSRLGVAIDQMPEELPEVIDGLHFHSMCEQNADVLERTLSQVEMKFGKYLRQVKWLNIGGGHHFTRVDYNQKTFIKAVTALKSAYDLQVIAEPGEAIGWETGYLVATVHDIVEANGFKTAMLNTSFAAHMPDCLEMPYTPSVQNTCAKEDSPFHYRLGGNTCLAGDFVGDYAFLNPLQVGDRIVFEDMMHYTMVKTNTFNGVKLPSIGIITSDGTFQLIREFGYDHYKYRLS